ncbi:MAG: RagB/SusD family nutrient uptake outer membrane protein [Mucilaginibacter sp.]|nr:RagB/SusD family nutrient uptake outer membrane protein [Mucilaginibacter sp.]
MNTMKNHITGICFLLFVISTGSCKKQDAFLDRKPNIALAVPTTLSDFELLLNNETLFNAYDSPALGNLSGDDFYVTNDSWISSETVAQNTYIFAKDIYQGSTINNDWNTPYQQIYYCNAVLDGLNKINISPAQLSRFNTIKGEALFFRAYACYNLVQTFAMPYDKNTANSDPGIPFPTNSDINKRYGRGTVQGTYDQIISDINTAATLVPATLTSVTKACKITCSAFLARIYLAMGKYDLAFNYSDKCLAQYSTLVDYNRISPGRNALSSKILAEDIFHTSLNGYSLTSLAQMDSTLYKSYDVNDLRRSYFFRKATNGKGLFFRGTYDIHNNKFGGLATDEMYLIRSECSARSGNLAQALSDLNALLKNRYVTGQFTQLSINNQDTLMQRILLERKKELYMRGLRWTDLRRLNKEDKYKNNVVRIINGTVYTLLPNDPKYALPIPDQELHLSGIPQNFR